MKLSLDIDIAIATPLVVLLWLADVPAKADVNASPPIASGANDDARRQAQALTDFRAGRDLMTHRHFEEACRAFAESAELDPGAGTLLNLGYCYERWGKTVSAWTTYLRAIDASHEQGRRDWEAAARERAQRLESLPRATIEVEDQPAEAALTIQVDGAPVGKSAWGHAVPLYPGRHELRAGAPERWIWTETFDVDLEHPPTLVIPVLEPLAQAEKTHLGAGQRTAAVVLGSAGVAALGVAAAFGLSSLSTYDNADCQSGLCTAGGKRDRSHAITQADLATAGAGIGGAALVGAALLWLTAPSSPKGLKLEPSWDRSTWGATLRGGW